MVVAVQFAQLVEREVLRSDDPAATDDNQGSGDCGHSQSVAALCPAHPLGSTSPSSTALAGAGGTGWRLEPTKLKVRVCGTSLRLCESRQAIPGSNLQALGFLF